MSHLVNFNDWKNKVTQEERLELDSVIGNDQEIKERFSLPLEFGTAGMRGVIAMGTYRMNEYTVRRATKGLSDYINSLGAQSAQAGVVVAYDTRLYSYEFAIAVSKVLSFNNIKVYLYEDVRPVPMCSFAIRHLGAIAGVMITASHNPKEYNGFKVYGSDGAQMSPEATDQVVFYIDKIKDYFSVQQAKININSREDIQGKDNEKINDNIEIIGESVDKEYFRAISKQALSSDAVARQADKMKVIYTPIHGTGYKPIMQIFDLMNIPVKVVEEQAQPDTNFSTVSAPNPENEDALKMGIELAKSTSSDVVIGTDPDGDRMGVALRADNGDFYLLNGNQIGVLLLDYILLRKTETNTLPDNAAAVKTIVTTSLARKVAENYGIEIYDVLTGFKFIGEKIKQWEADNSHTFVFGYEESYGYLAGTHSRDKDAIVATMLFAEMVAYYKDKGTSVNQRLKGLFEKHGYYVDKSVATVFKGLDGMAKMTDIMSKLRVDKIKEIAGYQVQSFSDYSISTTTKYNDNTVEEIKLPKANVLYYGLDGGDWVCVRPSGTEPKLKVYVSVSATDNSKAQLKADSIISYMLNLM